MLADPTVGPKGRRLLLSSLRSAARRDGPAAYFDFTGTGDGGGGHHTLLGGGGGGEVENGPGSLVLGHPLAWPSGRAGYTFAAWMRVESFPSSSSSRTKRMALFALRTASGLGVAAELSPDGVDVSTFSAGQSGVAKAENARLPADIEEKRWMFLVIAHSPGRPPLSTASVKLFVNGEQKSTAKLRFPKVTEPLTASSFGAFNEFDAAAMAAAAATSHHAVAKGAAAAAAVGAAPFAGQFGCVRFFDDVLGHSAVAAVNSLGPDYLGSFSPADTASGLALAGVGMSPSEAREIRESLAPRLVLSLNAAAAYGRDCYSTVADQGGSLGNLIKDVKEKGLVGVLKEACRWAGARGQGQGCGPGRVRAGMRHAQRQGHHTLPRRRSRPLPFAGAGEKRIYGRRRRRIRRRGTSRRHRPTRGDARRLAAEPGGAASQRGVRAHRAPAPPRRWPQALSRRCCRRWNGS